jgi:hypothetical protein
MHAGRDLARAAQPAGSRLGHVRDRVGRRTPAPLSAHRRGPPRARAAAARRERAITPVWEGFDAVALRGFVAFADELADHLGDYAKQRGAKRAKQR